MKQKILSLCLSIIFVLSMTSYGFADTDLDNPPTEPTKPSAKKNKKNKIKASRNTRFKF